VPYLAWARAQRGGVLRDGLSLGRRQWRVVAPEEQGFGGTRRRPADSATALMASRCGGASGEAHSGDVMARAAVASTGGVVVCALACGSPASTRTVASLLLRQRRR